MRRLEVRAAAVTLVAALAGCGGSDEDEERPSVSGDQRAILATIEALESASRRGDADRICNELFTEALARSIRRTSGRSCAVEVRRTLTSPDTQLSVGRGIDVRGSSAVATVREKSGSTSRVRLRRDGDRWRIERIEPVASR